MASVALHAVEPAAVHGDDRPLHVDQIVLAQILVTLSLKSEAVISGECPAGRRTLIQLSFCHTAAQPAMCGRASRRRSARLAPRLLCSVPLGEAVALPAYRHLPSTKNHPRRSRTQWPGTQTARGRGGRTHAPATQTYAVPVHR